MLSLLALFRTIRSHTSHGRWNKVLGYIVQVLLSANRVRDRLVVA